MGDYLKKMEDLRIGNPNVKAALRHLKEFHRNPLIHQEHSLETIDESIAIMNGIHAIITYMLKEIENEEQTDGALAGDLSSPVRS
ncbi:MAG: hypothetical protein WAK01_20295 [Methylocystis sp.]